MLEKKEMKWAVVVIIIVILVFAIFYLNRIDSVTAMDYRAEADSIAQEWNNTAKLIGIYGVGGADSEGNNLQWKYTYVTTPDNNSFAKSLEIIFSSAGSYSLNELTNPPSLIPITNLTIDSNQAVTISKSNSEISEFLSRYPTTKIDYLAFIGEDTQTNGCIICISWHRVGVVGDPQSIQIWIDGTNGDVIDVK